jgi:type II secretory pathway pseudopilin PulG
MVELIVSLGLFALLSTGLAMGLARSLDLTRNDKNRSVGSYLVAQDMEAIRSVNFALLTPGQTDAPTTVDGVPYTVRREVEYVSSGATANSCDSAATSPAGSKKPVSFVRVKVSVLWGSMGATKPPSAETLITPPIAAFDPNEGNVAVRVYNAAGKGMGGVPVTLSNGTSSDTVTTTDEGCAYFPFLAEGNYTASASVNQFVDYNGNVVASKPVTVVKSTTKAVQLDYDQASKMTVNYVLFAGLPLPAGGIPVTALNAKLTVGYRVFPGGIGAEVTDLFPFTNGYFVWAGGCSDADPEGENAPANGVRYYPAATRDPAVAVAPGSGTSVNLKLSGAVVTVKNGLGAPVPNVQVVADHIGDYRCAGESHGMGTTSLGGQAGASLPYGRWIFRTTIGSTPYYSGTVTLAPGSGSPAQVTIAVP